MKKIFEIFLSSLIALIFFPALSMASTSVLFEKKSAVKMNQNVFCLHMSHDCIPCNDRTMWRYQKSGKMTQISNLSNYQCVQKFKKNTKNNCIQLSAFCSICNDGAFRFKDKKIIKSDLFECIQGPRYTLGAASQKCSTLQENQELEVIVTKKLIASGPIESRPLALPDSSVVFGAHDGRLYRVSKNGKVLWSLQTKGQISSSPKLLNSKIIVFGSSDRHIYLVSLKGKILNKIKTKGPVDSSPTVINPNLFIIGSDDGGLYYINSRGKIIKQFKSKALIESTPLLLPNGKIIVGSDDKNLYLLNSRGKLEKTIPTGGRIWSSPARLPNGNIVVGADDGKVYFFNDKLELLNTYKTAGWIETHPLPIGESEVAVTSDDGKLYIFSSGGKFKASYSTGGWAESSPILSGQVLVFGSNDGSIYITTKKAKLVKRIVTGSTVKSTATELADGTIVVPTGSGHLYYLQIKKKKSSYNSLVSKACKK
ncbi:MAG: PQQ-binding-like beta-propeller repeat protein [Halobacteriovoraceae bacterium]|jgi:outer membrane protein assembly factor BamB|nr:PQQ-binding-like beta-propeller repeat protein [Halobacteriovoraceae bacterium]MBT5094141.1 PQQ-binding-like beta-propeller repeat protein [Halobacteriovoraceae bacterium]